MCVTCDPDLQPKLHDTLRALTQLTSNSLVSCLKLSVAAFCQLPTLNQPTLKLINRISPSGGIQIHILNQVFKFSVENAPFDVRIGLKIIYSTF